MQEYIPPSSGQPDTTGPLDSHPLIGVLPEVSTGSSDGKIIRREENAELLQARENVRAAQQRADNISSEVEAAVAAGREQGLSEGRAQTEQELATRLMVAEQQVDGFFKNADKTVLEIGVAVAKELVDLNMTESAARSVVSKTIEKYMAEAPATVHVSEDARANVVRSLSELRQRHPDARLPEIVDDPRLPAGRAILKTRFGVIDLDAESQLKAIAESLSRQP